jgi:hypothetical protein
MIVNDTELEVTLVRISDLHMQVMRLREMEANPENYHASVSGFLAEIDKMRLEVRDYLAVHPNGFAQ